MRRTGTRNRRNGTHGERAPTVHIYEPLKSSAYDPENVDAATVGRVSKQRRK